MARVLGVEHLDGDEVNGLVSGMRDRLESAGETTLETANALFLRRGIPFRETYVEEIGRAFAAEISAMPQTTDPINRWVSEKTRRNLRSRRVRLQMPRFTIEYETTLNRALQAAGLNLAFSPRGADFSRMVELENLGGENVYITEARHKAFIEVDEQGTEAAAVTSIEVQMTSAVPEPPAIPLMRLDRPFYFMIEETTTGSMLFFGRATDL